MKTTEIVEIKDLFGVSFKMPIDDSSSKETQGMLTKIKNNEYQVISMLNRTESKISAFHYNVFRSLAFKVLGADNIGIIQFPDGYELFFYIGTLSEKQIDILTIKMMGIIQFNNNRTKQIDYERNI